jgi:hypothetical protein
VKIIGRCYSIVFIQKILPETKAKVFCDIHSRVSMNKLFEYFITIENKSTWKVIYVTDGEMDTLEEHPKD